MRAWRKLSGAVLAVLLACTPEAGVAPGVAPAIAPSPQAAAPNIPPGVAPAEEPGSGSLGSLSGGPISGGPISGGSPSGGSSSAGSLPAWLGSNPLSGSGGGQDMSGPNAPIDAEFLEDCEAKGGYAIRDGLLASPICVHQTSDGGKSCSYDDECEGYCRAADNRCTYNTSPFGCRVSGICID